MSSSPVIEQFTKANEAYADVYAKKGQIHHVPGKKVAVVACMDCRMDPAKILGLEEGDAHVIRNAGGLARDSLRSIIVSQQLLQTDTVVILQHTTCGMQTFTNDKLYEKLQEKFGADAKDIDFQPFPDMTLDESVKKDIQVLRSSPFIPKENPIYGYIWDAHTGKLNLVEASV
jgi:carbonic anhydrase